MDAIASRAAEIALDKVYSDVGKSLIRRLAWLAGIVLLSLGAWMVKTGKIVL